MIVENEAVSHSSFFVFRLLSCQFILSIICLNRDLNFKSK